MIAVASWAKVDTGSGVVLDLVGDIKDEVRPRFMTRCPGSAADIMGS